MLTLQEAHEAGWGNRAGAFIHWLCQLDAIVEKEIGMSIDDLPDWQFADAFEDGMDPEDAAALFLDYIAEDFGYEIFG